MNKPKTGKINDLFYFLSLVVYFGLGIALSVVVYDYFNSISIVSDIAPDPVAFSGYY
jgi:hypothetical protein